MKSLFLSLLLSFGAFAILAQDRYWVGDALDNSWNNPNNWSTTSGGAGPASVPTGTNTVIFNGAGANGNQNCTVDIAGVTVSGLLVSGYTGTIEIQGNTFTTSGTVTLSTGTINDTPGTGLFVINSTATTTFSGTTISADVDITSGDIYLNGSIFNNPGTFVQTGTGTNVSCQGGNTFNAAVSFSNTGAAGSRWRMANNNPDIYNADVTFSNLGDDRIHPATAAAGTQFNGNIIVNSTGGSGVRFGYNGGSATLAAGMTISEGGTGLTGGILSFENFTQADASTAITINGAGADIYFEGTTSFAGSVTITGSGTGVIDINSGINFGGVVDFTYPGIRLDGGIFGAEASFDQNGTINTSMSGGNTFDGDVTIINSGDGYMRFSGSSGDTFNGNVTAQNTGTSLINFAHGSGTTTTFGGDIILECTSGTGIYFGNGDGASTLSDGNNISIGAGGFTTGTLYLRNFTKLGVSPQGLTLTGDAELTLYNALWNGPVNFSVPGITTRESTYNGAVFTVTGSGNDNSAGNNTFNGSTTFTHTGSGNLLMSNTTEDTFNGDLTLTNAGTGRIYIGHNGGETLINGNVTLNATGSALGIYFGAATGSVRLADGFSLSIGGSGFTTGTLEFEDFTQVGSTAQTLTLTGDALFRSDNSTWNGNIAFTAPRIFTDASTYNGTATLTKTGTSNDASVGGNLFEGDVVINNSGSAYVLMANTTEDTFNANLTLNNTSSERILIGYGAGQTVINGNIILNSTGTSTGIYFGTAGGSVRLEDGFTIDGSGFTTGTLDIEAFTQVGNTAQNITLTGDATLDIEASVWNSNVVFAAPSVYTETTTYNGTVSIQKTGAINNNSAGGNVFNDETTLINSGSGNMLMANGTEDIFNGTLTLINTGTEEIYIGYNGGETQLNGNVILNSTGTSKGIYFGANTGSVKLADGFTLSIGGSGFSTGTLYLEDFTQAGTTAQSLTLTGDARITIEDAAWNAAVTFIAPRLFSEGTTYNGITYLEKTGGSDDDSQRGNVFAADVTIVHSGSNRFRLATNVADTYSANATFTLTGDGDLRFADDGTNNFAGDLTLNNIGTGTLRLAYDADATANILGDADFSNTGGGYIYISNNATAATNFNGNITLENTGGGSILFGNGGGSATLASGKTITLGAAGFDSGELQLGGIIQLGATPQALTLTGDALLDIENAVWNADVAFSAPRVFTESTTYNGTLSLEKTGGSDDNSAGNNTFNDDVIFTQNGSGNMLMANVTEDVFNGTLTLTNTGSEEIYIGYNGGETQLNGNVILNSTGTSKGIYFGANNGSVKLADGFTLSIGSSGFSTGTLYLEDFTQAGTTAQSLTLTSDARITIEDAAWNAAVTFIAPRIFSEGTTYGGITYLEKTGALDDDSRGGNIFTDDITVVHSGTNRFRLATYVADTYNANATFTLTGDGDLRFASDGTNNFAGDLTLNNIGTGTLRLAFDADATANILGDADFSNTGGGYIQISNHATASVNFNGNITLENTGGGSILFGNGGGSATLASGKTITLGAAGFDSGELQLRGIIQLGATPQALTLTGTAILDIQESTWVGTLNFAAPRLYTNRSIYNGPSVLEKTGGGDDSSSGGNIFSNTTTFINSGSGYLMMGNGSPDIYSGTVVVNNTGTDEIYLAHNSAGNLFNGDITLNNAASRFISITQSSGATAQFNGNITLNSTAGLGIRFGQSGGSTTLSSGYTISEGGTGFNTGTLQLRNFIQSGTTAQAITLTGTAAFEIRESAFNGPITFSAPSLTSRETTYSNTANITKTGTTNNDWVGGNTYNATYTFTQTGSGRTRLSASAGFPDDYNGNATFNISAGTLEPSRVNIDTYAGNITINSYTDITFGIGNGGVNFNGTAAQSINNTGAASSHVIRNIVTNNTASEITLNTPITVTTSLQLTNGNLVTTSTNLLTLNNNATANAGSNAAFVDGPLRKVGDDPFIFPVGKAGEWGAIGISAPSQTGAIFQAEYFVANADDAGYDKTALEASIHHISDLEYWTLDRLNGGSPANDVFVTLYWDDAEDSKIADLTDLLVAKYDGVAMEWKNQGNGGTTGSTGFGVSGSIVSSAAISSFSPFTFASTSASNPLPVELISFTAKVINNNAVRLAWITASETNNDYFVLERSTNGIDYQAFAQVQGKGNTTEHSAYHYDDLIPYNGYSYYRLKQVDFDGKEETFSPVHVVLNPLISTYFSIYPNPSNGQAFKIRSTTGEIPTSLQVKVMTLSGQVVYHETVAGLNTAEIEIDFGKKLENGLYLIRIQNGLNQPEVYKLLVNQ